MLLQFSSCWAFKKFYLFLFWILLKKVIHCNSLEFNFITQIAALVICLESQSWAWFKFLFKTDGLRFSFVWRSKLLTSSALLSTNGRHNSKATIVTQLIAIDWITRKQPPTHYFSAIKIFTTDATPSSRYDWRSTRIFQFNLFRSIISRKMQGNV